MISEKAVADVQREVWERVGWKFSDESARQLIEAVLSVLPLHEGGWQPIETAPKDGTSVLICDADLNQNICFWGDCLGSMRRRGQHSIMTWCIVWSENDEQGGFNSIDDAAYWQPLPEQPCPLIAERNPSERE